MENKKEKDILPNVWHLEKGDVVLADSSWHLRELTEDLEYHDIDQSKIDGRAFLVTSIDKNRACIQHGDSSDYLEGGVESLTIYFERLSKNFKRVSNPFTCSSNSRGDRALQSIERIGTMEPKTIYSALKV